MAEHVFNSTLTIDLPRAEVFTFFADAENLERITPAALGFHIVTATPIEMRKGTVIEYKLSMRGIPMKWSSEITEWDPPHKFTDTQLTGPYKQWIHTHRFTEIEGGKTLMEDEVRYRLPFEPFGDVARFLVERELKNIFEYRNKTVTDLLLSKN
ncbi:MAG: SRPBCC family protein [Pyrinomonadaceae bacterium]